MKGGSLFGCEWYQVNVVSRLLFGTLKDITVFSDGMLYETNARSCILILFHTTFLLLYLDQQSIDI